MGRKKKEVVKNICTHCQKEFAFAIRWCQKCEDHSAADSWVLGKDVCDRCSTGENDEYIKRKKGRDKRIAAALERMKDPTTWCDCGAVEKYEAWCKSEAYKHRFDLNYKPEVVYTPAAEDEEELRTYEDPHGFIPGF